MYFIIVEMCCIRLSVYLQTVRFWSSVAALCLVRLVCAQCLRWSALCALSVSSEWRVMSSCWFGALTESRELAYMMHCWTVLGFCGEDCVCHSNIGFSDTGLCDV